MNMSSEFACGSSSCGTISGTIEPNAGAKSAWPTPPIATTTPSCQSVIVCVIARPAPTPVATARSESAAIIIRRRSIRSVSTPPASKRTTVGAKKSALIHPTAAALLVRS
jgi:hypothetical protein